MSYEHVRESLGSSHPSHLAKVKKDPLCAEIWGKWKFSSLTLFVWSNAQARQPSQPERFFGCAVLVYEVLRSSTCISKTTLYRTLQCYLLI